MKYKYKTNETCAREIEFSIEDGKVYGINFVGGCNGNLKAISKLLEGQSAEFIIEKLKGNTCGFKNTSCADQLAISVEKAIKS